MTPNSQQNATINTRFYSFGLPTLLAQVQCKNALPRHPRRVFSEIKSVASYKTAALSIRVHDIQLTSCAELSPLRWRWWRGGKKKTNNKQQSTNGTHTAPSALLMNGNWGWILRVLSQKQSKCVSLGAHSYLIVYNNKQTIIYCDGVREQVACSLIDPRQGKN